MSNESVTISPDSALGPLHNDHLITLEFDGKRYKSATHYIYAMMVPDKDTANFLNLQLDGKTVRKKANGYLFGKKAKGERRLPEASEKIMVDALYDAYKAFFFDSRYQNLLLGTNNEPFIYSLGKDTFLPGDLTVLGINKANNGQNKLGEIIERVRGEFRKAKQAEQRPPQQVHEIDRLFFAVIRHQLLMEQLRKGHFPNDYSLPALYVKSKGIPAESIDVCFQQDYPADKRIVYWELYQRGLKEKHQLLDADILDEFKTGHPDWIEREYRNYVQQYAILFEYLSFLKINYEVLKLSIAKEKVLEAYHSRRFEIVNDKPVQISMVDYLKKYEITTDTLNYIGEEALSDLRMSVYLKYNRGELSSIPDLDDKVAANTLEMLGKLAQYIVYPKIVPKIIAPNEKFKQLVALDVPPEPLSPRETYGGTQVDEYYPPILPKGVCGDSSNGSGGDDMEVCPMGRGIRGRMAIINEDGDGGDDGGDEAINDEDDGGDRGNRGKDEEDDRGDRNDEEDEGEFKMSDEVIGDDQDIDKAINQAKKQVVKKFVMPVNPIKFGDDQDYPYEWLSPYFISGLWVNGLYYPSVAHYVIAKLATPYQYRNIPIRGWILRDANYVHGKKDTKILPKDFYTIKGLIEALPDRLKEVYQVLYLRYADRAMNYKMRMYPFRQILFSTKPKRLQYFDDGNANAVAGKEVAKLLTNIRDKIDDIVELKLIPAPQFNVIDNAPLYDYVRDRTLELLKATILFTRYRYTPREDYPISDPILSLNFGDIHFILRNLYLWCQDINYNEVAEEPPKNYIAFFDQALEKLIKQYFPGRNIYDMMIPEVQDTIRLKNEGKNDDPMTDKIFIALKEIRQMIWTHICYIVRFLKEGIPDEVNALKQRIKDVRASLFRLKLGTREEVVVNAIVRILGTIHLWFPQQERISRADILFVNDFLYPIEHEIKESEKEVEGLVGILTDIYGGAEQPLGTVKELSEVVDGLINYPESDKVVSNKLTIKLKFFASS